MKHVTWIEANHEAHRLAARWEGQNITGVYGIPSGGVPVALIVSRLLDLPILEEPEPGCLVVDDLVDSGATFSRFEQSKDALYRKPWSPSDVAPDASLVDDWISFPWEKNDGAPEDGIVRLLQFVGEDPTREGLIDTPKRVLKAFTEMTAGYQQNPADILSTVFHEDYDQMVVLHGIEFVSMCEHHLQPFRGTAAVGYIPNGRVVGLSKLARLVDAYARRLQVQERMTEQIKTALVDNLDPVGVGVYIEAHHSCMGNRGVRKHQATMVTQALHGAIMDKPEARSEFMRLAQR
ncbi:MAG TPA: GTP cyclohydrolase I FolE [Acidimicrobiia bacterium]